MNDSLGDLQKAKRRMAMFGTTTLVALSVAAWSFFGGFVPAYQDYRRIKESLCIAVVHSDGSKDEKGCQTKETRVPVTGGKISWVSPFVGEAHATIVNEGETAIRDLLIASNLKYHGIGTSSAAIAETDGGCTTELTTQYNPDSTRATGSQTNNGADVYRSVGTNTVDGAATIEEFCLMDAASGAGNMLTRILTGTITLASGDGLQTTYDLTIA